MEQLGQIARDVSTLQATMAVVEGLLEDYEAVGWRCQGQGVDGVKERDGWWYRRGVGGVKERGWLRQGEGVGRGRGGGS